MARQQAPIPNWDQFTDVAILEADDLPADPDPDEDAVLEIADLEHLQLADHQRVMSLPVDMRIQSILYPASVKARVEREQKPKAARKNKWSDKLLGQLAGKHPCPEKLIK